MAVQINIGQVFVQVAAQVQLATFNIAQQVLGAVGQSAKQAATQVKGLNSTLGKLAAFFTGRKALSFAEELAHTGTKVQTTAKAIGLSTEALQEWGYVAKQAGSNTQEFARGVGQFERNLHAFAAGRGSKDFAEQMSKMGISREQAHAFSSEVGGIDRALMQLSGGISRMGATGDRGALGTALFGQRSGRAMLGDLSRGPEGIATMRAQARALGGVQSDDTINRLREVNSRIEDLKFAWQGAAANALAAVGPALVDALQAVARWVSDHREDIASFFKGFVEGVSNVVHAVETALKPLGMLVGLLFHGKSAADSFGKAFAFAVGVLAVGAVMKLVKSIAGISKAMKAAAKANPWLFAIQLILDGLLLVITYWDDIKSAAAATWDAIKSGAEAAFEFVVNLPVVKQLIWLFKQLGSLGSFISHPVQSMKSVLTNAVHVTQTGGRAGISPGAHQAIQGTTPGPTSRSLGGDASGGGGGSTSVTQHVKIDIHDATDPHKVGDVVKEQIDKLLRDASANKNGGKR